MYIHSVKLINYKSIGDYKENEIIIEPRVTTIIGKNESGKSNVLDGLSQIRFKSRNNAAFNQDIINRNLAMGTENKYCIILKPSAEDVSIGISEVTLVEITKNSYSATGGLLEFYLNAFYPLVDEIFELLGTVNSNSLQLKDQEWSNYQIYYKELANQSKIDIPLRTSAFDFLCKRAERIAIEKRENFAEKTKQAKDKWIELISKLPVFFYRKSDKHLSTTYKFDDIDKELKNPSSYPNSLLSNLVKVIGITNEEFLLASRSGITPNQENIRRKINRLINDRINKKFNEFYATEEVFLDIGFNNGIISFVIQSNNGSSLMLSERSNGLRWYLETFIDASANDISDRNTVYLLDEPGVSLHVNAQRELLNLFNHLADRGNQVIYTTHSPYMLDTEKDGVHRIRAVVKDEEGYSRIYKTAYDSRISADSQKDTLTPIINALGMNLYDTFGPAKDKINIVTEGMSDYIYICLMAKLLKIPNENYAIIPSVGATNCVHLCSILHGWGCKYIAVFDYDKEGVESGGEYLRNKMFFEQGKQYCYMKEISQSEIDSKTYKTEDGKYMVEDLVTKEELERFCSFADIDMNIGKPLVAKLLSNAVENGTYTIGKDCFENFKTLFARISTYVA